MGNASGFFGTGFGLVVAIFLFILAILWLLMPLAVISIQKRVIDLVAVNRMILIELQSLNSGVREATELDTPTKKCPNCSADKPEDAIRCAKCGEKFSD